MRQKLFSPFIMSLNVNNYFIVLHKQRIYSIFPISQFRSHYIVILYHNIRQFSLNFYKKLHDYIFTFYYKHFSF